MPRHHLPGSDRFAVPGDEQRVEAELSVLFFTTSSTRRCSSLRPRAGAPGRPHPGDGHCDPAAAAHARRQAHGGVRRLCQPHRRLIEDGVRASVIEERA